MVIRKDLKPIPGSERELVKNAKAIGAANPEEVVEVTVALRSKGAATLSSSISEMSAQSLKERRYLSREELAAANALNPDDLAKIEEFAHEHGLTIVKVSPESSSVSLSGTVSQLSEAFGTELLMYDSPVGKYRGRVGPVQVPADLAPIIVGVFGLDDRHVFRPHSVRLEKQGGTVKAMAAGVSYTPPQLAKLYNFPTGLDGSKQCIAIIELGGGYKASDINAYFKGLGMTPPKVVAISVDGAQNKPGSDADGEVVLDIEVTAGIAPKAKIAVYFAPNSAKGFIDAINAAVHDTINKPTVISISWGAPEKAWTHQAMQSMDLAFQKAAAIGVTAFCASGDDGSNDNENDNNPHVDFPASSPTAIGCGGTSLSASGEIAWSGSGGGVSDFFPLPGWQSKAHVPLSVNGFAGRGVPDVAGDADPNSGYIILLNGKNYVFGGTSAVAPLWAGLIALINQKLGKSVGYLNPLIYNGRAMSLAAFHDITVGSNGAYNAGPGWDPCTGLGRPIGTGLLQDLSKL
ncbi:Pro-kumamolisin, activation domain [uncultured archaeon]|nr:Pro-kumamolisin, activation domain [uncultured archaeon]